MDRIEKIIMVIALCSMVIVTIITTTVTILLKNGVEKLKSLKRKIKKKLQCLQRRLFFCFSFIYNNPRVFMSYPCLPAGRFLDF